MPHADSMPETPLSRSLREEIARRGAPMSFREFMAAALYHPQHGYYASGRARIGGQGGDFFTNVSVGPLFGRMLAGVFLEMWQRLGKPREFTLAEQGAAGGDFAHDVLERVKMDAPDFFRALRYAIIEPLPAWRERQETKLASFGGTVLWRESLETLEPFTGVHFSNELLDAFPVHLIRFVDGAWRERCVGPDFSWVDAPISDGALRRHIEGLPLPRISGYTAEINLDALAWIDLLGGKLQRGWVLAVDYGYPRDVLYAPGRVSGTLRCHAAHRRGDDPRERPGERDITAHVDFTTLAERAETSAGLRLAGFTDQHHFLTALTESFFAGRTPDAKETRALQTLLHPELLGSAFKYLALEKNIPPAAGRLSGFCFARDPRLALGVRAP